MNQVLYAFLLSFLAGISTILGSLLIFIKIKKEYIINISLSFAAGVMLSVSFFDLIKESYLMFSTDFSYFYTILLVITTFLVGFTISKLMDKFIPKKNDNLYRVGVISMVALILHNIPEGIATYMTSSSNLRLGLTLSIAIALHNIPEGISISIPIYYATKSYSRAFIYTLISGLSELVGAVISYLFLSDYVNNIILGIIYGIIAGLMTHISIFELIKETLTFKNLKISIISFGVGVMIMYLTHLIL